MPGSNIVDTVGDFYKTMWKMPIFDAPTSFGSNHKIAVVIDIAGCMGIWSDSFYRTGYINN